MTKRQREQEFEVAGSEFISLRICDVQCDRECNCRYAEVPDATSEEDFRDLIENIRINGVIHPPGVRRLPDGAFGLVWGFRRLEACKAIDPRMKLAFRLVPASDNLSARVYNLSENIHHQGLAPYEIAEALFRVHEEHPDVPISDIAQRCGLNPHWGQKLYRVRSKIHPDLWDIYRAFYASVSVNELDEIARLPRARQLEAWKRLRDSRTEGKANERNPNAKRAGRPTVRHLSAYLRSVAEIRGSEDFRAGVDFALRVALGKAAWSAEEGTRGGKES